MKCAKQGRERVFLRDIARTAFLSRKSTKATHTLNLCHTYPSPRLTSPLLFLSPFPCATAVRRHFSGRDPPPAGGPPPVPLLIAEEARHWEPVAQHFHFPPVNAGSDRTN